MTHERWTRVAPTTSSSALTLSTASGERISRVDRSWACWALDNRCARPVKLHQRADRLGMLAFLRAPAGETPQILMLTLLC